MPSSHSRHYSEPGRFSEWAQYHPRDSRPAKWWPNIISKISQLMGSPVSWLDCCVCCCWPAWPWSCKPAHPPSLGRRSTRWAIEGWWGVGRPDGWAERSCAKLFLCCKLLLTHALHNLPEVILDLSISGQVLPEWVILTWCLSFFPTHKN